MRGCLESNNKHQVVPGDCYPNNIHLIRQSTTTFASGEMTAVGSASMTRRVQWVRVDADRDSSPSAASLDSQTVRSAVMVHEAVGYDAGKKIKSAYFQTSSLVAFRDGGT
jgi:hypothetical protein